MENVQAALRTEAESIKRKRITVARPLEGLEIREDAEKFNVKLDKFEGHFEVLLDMIEEQKVDICEISLAQVTGQYLDFLSLAQELNLSSASEFMVIAAYLMEQKSKVLLPKEEGDEQEEKIKTSLIDHLMQYDLFKRIAVSLKEKKEAFSSVFHRAKADESLREAKHYTLKDVGVEDLVSAFRKVWLEVKSRGEQTEIADEVVTVGEKIAEIREMLSSRGEAIDFKSLFRTKTRLEVIVTFLALLEMIKTRDISVKQDGHFGGILIFPGKGTQL